MAKWMNWAITPTLKAAKAVGVYKGPVGEEWIKEWDRLFKRENRERAKLIREETKALRDLIAAIKKPTKAPEPGTPGAYKAPGLKRPPPVPPPSIGLPLEPLRGLEKGTVEAAEAAYRNQQRPLADLVQKAGQQVDLLEDIEENTREGIALKEAKA